MVSEDLEHLGGIASDLESIVEHLRRHLAAYGSVGPTDVDLDLESMKRIRVARSRLQALIGTSDTVPDFVVDNLYTLVEQRLASTQ